MKKSKYDDADFLLGLTSLGRQAIDARERAEPTTAEFAQGMKTPARFDRETRRYLAMTSLGQLALDEHAAEFASEADLAAIVAAHAERLTRENDPVKLARWNALAASPEGIDVLYAAAGETLKTIAAEMPEPAVVIATTAPEFIQRRERAIARAAEALARLLDASDTSVTFDGAADVVHAGAVEFGAERDAPAGLRKVTTYEPLDGPPLTLAEIGRGR